MVESLVPPPVDSEPGEISIEPGLHLASSSSRAGASLGTPDDYAYEEWSSPEVQGWACGSWVMDFDADGKNEVLFFVLEGDYVIFENRTLKLYMYEYGTHQLEWESPGIEAASWTSFMENIDGDSAIEIVIIRTWWEGGSSKTNSSFLVFDGATHSVEWSTPGLGIQYWGNLLCVDLDGDGSKELVFSAVDIDSVNTPIRVYVYSIAPYTLLWKSREFYYSYIRMDVLDVDNDGSLEIVVVSSYIYTYYNSHGYVYIYDGATRAEEWNSTDIGKAIDLAFIRDIDGDGVCEIGIEVFEDRQTGGIGSRSWVYVYDGATHNLDWTSPVYETVEGTSGWIGIDHGDLDDDGVDELFIAHGILIDGIYHGCLDIFDGSTFNLEYDGPDLGGSIWSFTDYENWDSFLIADVDGDNETELMFLVGECINSTTTNFTFHVINGSMEVEHVSDALPFDASEGLPVYCHFGVLDADGDSGMEILIILSSSSPVTTSQIHVFNGSDYSHRWSSGDLGGYIQGFTEDLDGDSILELVVFTRHMTNKISVFNLNDGNIQWFCESVETSGYFAWPGDWDDDGLVEMHAVTPSGNLSRFTIIEFGKRYSPWLENPIEDIVMAEDTIDTSINLSEVFGSRPGDIIEYAGGSLDECVYLTFDPDGAVTIEPGPNFYGTVTAEIYALNSHGPGNATVRFNITVTPVNDPPVILFPLEDIYGYQDEWMNVSAWGHDLIDGEVVELGENCSLFEIDEASGLVAFLPCNQDVGTYPVSYWVKDENNTYAYSNITIHILNVNDPPEIMKIDGEDAVGGLPNGTGSGPGSIAEPILLEAIEDQWLNFTITALDIDETELSLDEQLRFSCNLTLEMSNLFIDSITGVVSFMPAQADVEKNGGLVYGSVKVTDIGGLWDVAHFVIEVENVLDPLMPPTFTWNVADEYPQTPEKENLTVTFTGFHTHDPDYQYLEYTWDFDDGTTEEDNGILIIVHTFPEEGNYTVTLTVSDGNGGEANYQEVVQVLEYDPPDEEEEEEEEEEEQEDGGEEEDQGEETTLPADSGKANENTRMELYLMVFSILAFLVVAMLIAVMYVFRKKKKDEIERTDRPGGDVGPEVLVPTIIREVPAGEQRAVGPEGASHASAIAGAGTSGSTPPVEGPPIAMPAAITGRPSPEGEKLLMPARAIPVDTPADDTPGPDPHVLTMDTPVERDFLRWALSEEESPTNAKLHSALETRRQQGQISEEMYQSLKEEIDDTG